MIFGRKRARRRKELLEQEVSQVWMRHFESWVPGYRLLAAGERRLLAGYTAILLDEKTFEGCNDLELTEEMRVAIAGGAALLLLGRGGEEFYPTLETILVYPEPFRVSALTDMGGVLVEEEEVRSGESWVRGQVIVSWADVELAAREPELAYHVVLHEFAHQLDDAYPDGWGTPNLGRGGDYERWQEVMSGAFARLVNAAEAGEETLLDPYGAVSPGEFFAVATECFFLCPSELVELEPELYCVLRGCYGQDPAKREREWLAKRAVLKG